MLDMNRQQLVTLTILLTLLSAVLAGGAVKGIYQPHPDHQKGGGRPGGGRFDSQTGSEMAG